MHPDDPWSAWHTLCRRAEAAGWSLSRGSRPGEAWYDLCPLGDRRPERVVRLNSVEAVERYVEHKGRPMHLDTIITGDARKLARTIPDGSVDLILADPVYQNIRDYTWLAKTALRVLKPRGVLLAWASVPKAGRAQAAMERAGMAYVYTLFYTVIAKTYRMRWYNLFCWTTPCLWFQRPGEATRPNQWMPDTFSETVIQPADILDNTTISTANATGPFEWNKNTGVLMKYIEQYSKPGDVVYDPFTGTGSVPCACRATGRRFIASEIDAARAEEARVRLAATPLPLESAARLEQGSFVGLESEAA